MGVASGCGEQEVGVASGNGCNLWVWLLGVVLRRYIDFLILLIPASMIIINIFVYTAQCPTWPLLLFNILILVSTIISCNIISSQLTN